MATKSSAFFLAALCAAVLFPTLEATYNATHSYSGPKSGSVSALTTGVPAGGFSTSFVPGVSGTWDLDVWGKVRRQIESNVSNAQVSAADLANAKLSAQATLATDYFDLRAEDALTQLLTDTVAAYRRAMQIAQNQYHAGTQSSIDYVTALAQLQSTEAQLVAVGVQRQQYEHAIAMLTGHSPAEITIAPARLATAVPVLPPGLPSALLERRPDIAAAERRTAEANAQVGVARVAYFPSLTLGAQGGFVSGRYANLLTAPNHVWALGPSLLLDVFDAGRRKAQVAAAKAAADEAGARYRGVVLGAFQQVEDNLALLDRLGTAMVDQKVAAAAAQHSLDLAMQLYKQGAASYLDVVQAQTAALQVQSEVLSLGTQQLRASVQLIRALGGSWSRHPPVFSNSQP